MTVANPSLDLKNIIITPLAEGHSLSNFKCGEGQIDRFVCRKASKYHSTNRMKMFCAHEREAHTPLGVYTLTMRIEETNKLNSRERDLISDKYFPAIYIGTLAVQQRYQNQGLGTILLMNALSRAYYVGQNLSVFGVALRSLNERTTKMYEGYGFGLRDQSTMPLMVLPIWSLNELFENR